MACDKHMYIVYCIVENLCVCGGGGGKGGVANFPNSVLIINFMSRILENDDAHSQKCMCV